MNTSMKILTMCMMRIANMNITKKEKSLQRKKKILRKIKNTMRLQNDVYA